MEETFVIWDETCSRVLLDIGGKPCFLNETEVRRGIGNQSLGVMRNGKVRMIYARDREKALPLSERHIPPSQPYCVKVTVGDTHHVFMHVAERCQAAYDGRPMPKRYNADGTVRRNEYGRETRVSAAISASCL